MLHHSWNLLNETGETCVAREGDNSCAYTVSVGKTDRKGPLARPRRRWKDGIIIWIMWIFKEKKERARTGFTWLRTGTSDELMCTRHWTFWFRKTQGIRLAEAVLALTHEVAKPPYILHGTRWVFLQTHACTLQSSRMDQSSLALQHSTFLRQLLQQRHFSHLPPPTVVI